MELHSDTLANVFRNPFAFYNLGSNSGNIAAEMDVPPRKKLRLNSENQHANEDRENQQPSTSSNPISLSPHVRTNTGIRKVQRNRRALRVLSLQENTRDLLVSPVQSVNEFRSKPLKPRKTVLLQRKKVQKRSSSINQQQINEFMRRKESPLTNDLILENIFQYFGAETLASCRLVNKQWNSTSTAYLGTKHAPIVFNKTKDTFRFARVMKKSSNFPYHSFVLKTKYSDRVDKYFENFGPQIKNLQVVSKAGREIIDFQNLYDVLDRTPNLETLEVGNVDFPLGLQFQNAIERDGGTCLTKLASLRITGWFMHVHHVDRIQDFSRFISPIFKRCSHLKILDLDIFRTTILPAFLAGLKHTPALDTITIRCVSEEDILLILESGIKLKKATLNEVQLTREGVVFSRFMETMKDSLEFLSLRIMGNQDVVPFRLPRMAALKTLSMDRYFSTDVLPFESLRNATPIPFLQKLSINQDFMTAMVAGSSDFMIHTVQDLTIWMNDLTNSGTRLAIQDDDQNFDMDQSNNVQLILIQNLPLVFPNLSKLMAVDAKCSAIRGIFTYLTGLEELHINYMVPRYSRSTVINLTRTLTGIPNSDWMAFALRDWIKDTSISSAEKQTVMNFVNAAAQPSLRLLKNLKILKLSGKLMISDASVFLALLSIQPLQKLILQDSAAILASATLEELKKYHKFVSSTAEPTKGTKNE